MKNAIDCQYIVVKKQNTRLKGRYQISYDLENQLWESQNENKIKAEKYNTAAAAMVTFSPACWSSAFDIDNGF